MSICLTDCSADRALLAAILGGLLEDVLDLVDFPLNVLYGHGDDVRLERFT